MCTESTNHGSVWIFQARLNSSLNIVRKFWQQTMRHCCNLSLSLCIIPTYLPTYPPTHPPTYLPTHLPTYLPTYLSIYLHIYIYIYIWTKSYSPGQMWRWFTVFSIQCGLYILAGFVLCQGYIPEKHKNTKLLYFLGVRGLTSSYILYVYATSGHTDL